MPPTGRRRKAKEPAADQRVDADAADAADAVDVATPSRKKRKVNGSSNAPEKRARRNSVESNSTIENQDEGSSDGIPPEHKEAEAVIQKLKVAQYKTGVSIDYNNAIVPPNETAFAKIAGRDWTYYVKRTNVVIGRPNAKPKRESNGTIDGEGRVGTPDMQVNIDLGPDQQVSRVHADISYDSDSATWVVRCNGRNGLHLDMMRIERGQQANLHSGAVLSILGTQMIFLLPNELPQIHPWIRDKLLNGQDDDDDEKYEPRDDQPKGTNIRYGNHAQKSFNPTVMGGAHGGGSGTQAAHALTALSGGSHQAPGTPKIQPPQPKSKNSPAYTVKGVMMESTEEIDYSADSSKDIKPPHSYAQMIGQAIMSREGENATLAQIYEFIKDNYAYFRLGGGGWQNSIRHNLSLSKHFEKIPRRTDEPGKGMKWQIVPEHRDEYMKKNFHDNRRPQRRLGSSGPNSPAQYAGGPGVQTERLMGAINNDAHHGLPNYMSHHFPSGEPVSPTRAYPSQPESYTPERGSHSIRLQISGGVPTFTNGAAPLSATSDVITPSFERGNPLQLTNDSPPAAGALNHDASIATANMHTPLPARSAPLKAFPSSVKPPSFYAKELFSSPAPFWKYADVGGFGSTPLKPMLDLSPEKFMKMEPKVEADIKTDVDEEEEDDDDDDEIEEKWEDDDEEVGVGKKESRDDEVEADETILVARAESEGDEKVEVEVEIQPPSSPLGKKKVTLPQEDEEEDNIAPDESPTRTVSRPVSRREAANTSAIPFPTNGLNPSVAQQTRVSPTLQQRRFDPPPRIPQLNAGMGHHGSGYGGLRGGGYGMEDEDEDEGIDLSKTSFQKIGQFHRSLNAGRHQHHTPGPTATGMAASSQR